MTTLRLIEPGRKRAREEPAGPLTRQARSSRDRRTMIAPVRTVQPRMVEMLGTRFGFWSLALSAMLVAGAARAQLPGAPVLQNAFTSSGFTAAVDGAGGSGSSAYALAGAWSATRLQLSLGLGMQSGAGASRFAYGLRAAVPILAGDRPFGVAAFVGLGGTSGAKSADSVRNVQLVPVGATLGFRSAAMLHGASAYVSPIYEHYSGGAVGQRGGNLFRTALGVDLGITNAIGMTVGVELGQSASASSHGPRGTSFGLGFSYAMLRP